MKKSKQKQPAKRNAERKEVKKYRLLLITEDAFTGVGNDKQTGQGVNKEIG